MKPLKNFPFLSKVQQVVYCTVFIQLYVEENMNAKTRVTTSAKNVTQSTILQILQILIHELRSYAASIVTGDYDMALWITGGFDGYNILRSTEFVSPTFTGESTLGPELPKSIREHCLIKLTDTLSMLIGGVNNGRDTYVFSFQYEQWVKGGIGSCPTHIDLCLTYVYYIYYRSKAHHIQDWSYMWPHQGHSSP